MRAFVPKSVSVLAQAAANTDMEILAEKIKADKKLLVGINMSLTNEEARDFWSLYDKKKNGLNPGTFSPGMWNWHNRHSTPEIDRHIFKRFLMNPTGSIPYS